MTRVSSRSKTFKFALYLFALNVSFAIVILFFFFFTSLMYSVVSLTETVPKRPLLPKTSQDPSGS